MTHPFPEPDAPELAPFAVHARAEILSLLGQLREQGVLVTAYCEGSPDFAVTAVLAVNPQFEELVVDNASDPAAQRRLLAAEALTFVCFLSRIKVQFRTRAAEATMFEGKPALRVRLPEVLLRLQRREAFRVHTPLARPAHCLVPYADDGRQYEKLRMLDVSIGGMGLLAYPHRFDLAVGAVIDACFLDLPGAGTVAAGIRVQHVEAVPREERARRIGCEFVHLAPQARLMLQRYVNLLDADRRRIAGVRAA